jgi:hypothetical protein
MRLSLPRLFARGVADHPRHTITPLLLNSLQDTPRIIRQDEEREERLETGIPPVGRKELLQLGKGLIVDMSSSLSTLSSLDPSHT